MFGHLASIITRKQAILRWVGFADAYDGDDVGNNALHITGFVPSVIVCHSLVSVISGKGRRRKKQKILELPEGFDHYQVFLQI